MNQAHKPEDKFVTLDSVKTRYWEIGERGPRIVLIHGIGGFAENWRFNIENLAGHFKVYAVDLVGFGKSGKPKAPYTYDYFARFIKEFIDVMEIDKAVLIGHSLGGGIAMRFALMFPGRVEKLVLVDSAGLGKEISKIFKLISLPGFGELVTRPDRTRTLKMYKNLVYDRSLLSEEMVDLGFSFSSSPGAQQAFLKTARGTVNIFGFKRKAINPIRRNLHRIEVPVLVLWGERDAIIPVRHAYIAKDGIPDAELEVFENCGHIPMIECPDEFNTAVVKFLRER
mgnify:FL=1